jgi:hypothetical protein
MLTKRQLEDAAECMSHDCESCGVREFAGGCCQIATAQTAIAYRVMLERLEWVDNDYCPICGQYKANGHANDCELAALLKESELKEEKARDRNEP